MSTPFHGYYDVIDTVMQRLRDKGCRKVEHGLLNSFALDKVNVTPYGYVSPSTNVPNIKASTFALNIFVGGLVRFDDLSEKEEIDVKHGHNNLQDVLDETQWILATVLTTFTKIQPINDSGLYVHLASQPALDPFEEKGNEVFAGWMASPIFTVNQSLDKC